MLQPDTSSPQRPPTGSAAPPAPPLGDAAAERALLDLLARARSRQRRIILTSAALACAAGLALALPLVFGLGAAGIAASRPLAWVVLAVAAAGFAWAGLLRARREAGDEGAVARRLAQAMDDPAARRGLLPAWELSRALRASGDADFSPALARAHIASVAGALNEQKLAQALPDRPVRLAGLAAAAAVAVAALAMLLFPAAMTRGARFVVSADEGASEAEPAAEPITGEIELTYRYPAYTRLAPRTVPNTNGEIAAPRGTEVRLRTRADREVAQAFVVLGQTGSAESALPLQVKGGRDLEGAILVDKAGSYRFRFLDARNRVLAEGPPIPIAVEQDGAPKVQILAPATDLEVEPTSRVVVRFDAEDDYGLSEVALLFKLPGATQPTRVVLQRPADEARRASGEYSWEIAPLGAMAGDRIAYYVEAADGDQVSGRKLGASRTQYLKIYSEAEHHRQAMKRIEESWEKLVMLLADRLEAPERAPNATAEAVLGQAATDARGRTLAEELADLARTLRKDKAPEQLTGALLNVASGLRQKVAATSAARSSMSTWLQRGGAPAGSSLERLRTALTSEIAEEEKDVLYLETLLDQQRVKDLVSLAKELSAKRRDLAGLLEKYRTAPDEATRDRLLSEIARLKERMSELMQRMAELSRGIRDEHVNAEALEQMGKTGEMMDAFDKLQELLHKGQVEEAMKEMEKLGQMLDGLQQQLQKASGEFQGGQFGEMAQKLDRFAKDLDALARDQEEALQKTQEVRGHYKQMLEQRLAQKGKDFAQKLRGKVQEAQKRLDSIEVHDFWRENGLRSAREQLSELDTALAVEDFDQASQSAGKALQQARQLADELENMAADARRYPSMGKPDEATRNASNAQAAVPPLAEVQKELSQLFPSPAQAMTEEDKQAMRQMAEQQSQLQQRAQQLQQQMGELNQKAPLFPQQSQDMMGQTQERMGRAQGQLQGRNPHGAAGEQRAALDQLGQLKKGLEGQQQGAGGAGQPIPWPWMGPGGSDGNGEEGMGLQSQQDQKVVIPGAEQYQVPEEYRKDILDAMKQGAPDRYREQVKRYYQEIVK